MVSQTWSGPLKKPASIPEAADVVIIGGGIVGASTAWFLSKQGVSVALCEKGHIAGEQSSRNWGWVRQQGRDTRELPMMIDSMRIWRDLAEAIGEDVGFTQAGCLFAAKNDKQLAGFHEWLDVAKDYELDTVLLSREQLRAQVRGAAVDWPGAMFTASDGRAEPHKATPAIARAAERCGAIILTACAAAASKQRQAMCPPSSLSTAGFGHRRCCVPRAHGRQCFADRSAYRCRNCRCAEPSYAQPRVRMF